MRRVGGSREVEQEEVEQEEKDKKRGKWQNRRKERENNEEEQEEKDGKEEETHFYYSPPIYFFCFFSSVSSFSLDYPPSLENVLSPKISVNKNTNEVFTRIILVLQLMNMAVFFQSDLAAFPSYRMFPRGNNSV